MNPIELLEPRIAPATMFTYTEADGDLVKASFSIAFSGGIFTAPSTTAAEQTRFHVDDLPAHDGLNITIAVIKRGPDGDGFVQYGKIDAPGVNLGSVTIVGDLAEIDAGDGTPGAVAVKSLTVRSFGAVGASTIQGGGDLHSVLHGSVGSLTVRKDFDGVFFELPDAGTKLVSVTIGGNLLGRDADDSGRLSAPEFGKVAIAGSIIGGDGSNSGLLQSTVGGFGSVKIGKSIVGGSGVISGAIFSQAGAGAVSVGGSVIGGSNTDSGRVDFLDAVASFKVKGSIIGGAGSSSGLVRVAGAGAVTIGGDIVGVSAIGGDITDSGVFKGISKPIKSLKIGGSIIGGSVSGTGDLIRSGTVDLGGSVTGSVTIGGSIVAGVDDSSGTVSGNGSVNAFAGIGSIAIKGSVLGHSSQPAFIGVTGGNAATGSSNVVLGKLSIAGDVTYAVIAGGFSRGTAGELGDVQIGSVSVGGDWRASSLTAGVLAGPDGRFANADDTTAASASAGFISSIASIVIKGALYGTSNAGEHFGFTAEAIGSLKIGSRTVTLSPTALDVLDLLPNSNVSVREVAIA